MNTQTKEEMDARRLGPTGRRHMQKGGAARRDCAANRSDLVNTCYHGSSCIDANNPYGLLDKYCECDAADGFVAGLMCQYEATSTCVEDEDAVSDQFCVNGGQCVGKVGTGDSHPGCICEDDKWEGKHCEYAHGVLLDDALDLFQQRVQQRKAEMESGKLGGGGGGLGTKTTLVELMDGGNKGRQSPSEGEIKTVGTLGEPSAPLRIPLLVALGSFVGIFVLVKLSMFAVQRSRITRKQSNEGSYHGVGGALSKASKSTQESTLPPPATVFLASRKKEVEIDDGNSFLMSPGIDAEMQESGVDNVELLDDETTRMIESQFNDGVAPDEDSVEEQVQVDAPAFDSDSEVSDDDELLRRSGRITVNSGKDPLSKLQSEVSADDGLVDVVVSTRYENEEGVSASEEKRHSNNVMSLDGEYDDDSDDDNYFV